MTKQQRWQIKKKSLGCCIICGKTREKYAILCNFHYLEKKRKEKEDKYNRVNLNLQETLL